MFIQTNFISSLSFLFLHEYQQKPRITLLWVHYLHVCWIKINPTEPFLLLQKGFTKDLGQTEAKLQMKFKSVVSNFKIYQVELLFWMYSSIFFTFVWTWQTSHIAKCHKQENACLTSFLNEWWRTFKVWRDSFHCGTDPKLLYYHDIISNIKSS